MSAFIDEKKEAFGVGPICRTLGVSASAYYQRATGERSARRVVDERLLRRIEELHAANYFAYGYRRMWKALTRAGEQVGRDRVKRLMRQHAIQGAKRRGKPWRTTTPDPAPRRPPDLVERNFSATRPNALWVADFCHLRCWQGVVFFSFVIDVFSRRVIGWQFANHMRTDLVLDALRMALTRRPSGADLELVHHSDAGSQPGSEGRSSCQSSICHTNQVLRREGLLRPGKDATRRLSVLRLGVVAADSPARESRQLRYDTPGSAADRDVAPEEPEVEVAEADLGQGASASGNGLNSVACRPGVGDPHCDRAEGAGFDV